MPDPAGNALITVVIPTLAAGPALDRTLDALAAQSLSALDIVVVDNSARGLAASAAERPSVRVIANPRNVGFGEAINQGGESSAAPYVLALNDDARPAPDCLERLAGALDADPEAGMAAPAILLASSPDSLDSAGLNIYPDGVGKQRGHGRPAADFAAHHEALLPSGCAALYRRAMLDHSGWFDPDYFLYGEDTDIGLRGRWAGWTCRYVPQARVEHDYSGSAGRASRLKAFYVERNRLWTAVKCFPLRALPWVPLHAAWRYLHHLAEALRGRGLASEYGRGGENPLSLVVIVWSAHWRTLTALPALLSKRRRVMQAKRLSAGKMAALLRRFRVSAAEVARQ